MQNYFCNDVRAQTELPLRHDSLGLGMSNAVRECAYWASWMDCISVLHDCFEEEMLSIANNLDNPFGNNCESLNAVRRCQNALQNEGLDTPTWTHVCQHTIRPPPFDAPR